MAHKTVLAISFSTVIIMIFFAFAINLSLFQPITKGHDIYYSYIEGKRLVDGENPYGRILESDMRQNQKYATYFPVFYELSYLSQKLGLQSLESWIAFWRIIFMLFEFATAIFLYIVLAKRNLAWAGVFAAAFWLFNRWSLNLVEKQNLDFVPIFLFLLSLALFPRKKGLSLFLFSLSLGLKQIAIFAIPVYLIWEFHSAGKDWLKQVSKSGLIIASVPLISGLPFLILNAKAFIKSVLFSATRLSGSYSEAASLDVLMKWDGLPGRALMLALMLFVYFLAFKGQTKKYFSILLVLMVFIGFNNTLFPQYVLWMIPVFLLTFCDFHDATPTPEKA